MNSVISKLSPVYLILVLIFILTGCSKPVEVMKDKNRYVYSVTDLARGWKVESDRPLDISINQDQIVEVGGKKTSSSGSDYFPDIRVSGQGVKFKVFLCSTLVTNPGTIVDAYSCESVKARAGSTVSVFVSKKLLAIYQKTRIINTKSVDAIYCFRNSKAVDEEAEAVDCSTGEPKFPDKYKPVEVVEPPVKPAEKPKKPLEEDLKDEGKIPDGNYRMN